MSPITRLDMHANSMIKHTISPRKCDRSFAKSIIKHLKLAQELYYITPKKFENLFVLFRKYHIFTYLT